MSRISISLGAALVSIAHLAAAELPPPALLVLHQEDYALKTLELAGPHFDRLRSGRHGLGGKEMTE